MQLFPRGLFEDALPPIALRSQVYSLVPDRTVADLQLVRSASESFGVPSLPRPAASSSLEGTRHVPVPQTLRRPDSPSAGVRARQMQSKSHGFGNAGRRHITQTSI